MNAAIYHSSNGTRRSNHGELLDEGFEMKGFAPPTPEQDKQLYCAPLLCGKPLTPKLLHTCPQINQDRYQDCSFNKYGLVDYKNTPTGVSTLGFLATQ